MAARAGGAPQRRRARWLRSFLRHERMTVRMALAEALHHSCGVEPSGPNEGPRGLKTASAVGMRPEALEEGHAARHLKDCQSCMTQTRGWLWKQVQELFTLSLNSESSNKF